MSDPPMDITPQWVPGEKICHQVLLPWDVLSLEVVHPTCLQQWLKLLTCVPDVFLEDPHQWVVVRLDQESRMSPQVEVTYTCIYMCIYMCIYVQAYMLAVPMPTPAFPAGLVGISAELPSMQYFLP